MWVWVWGLNALVCLIALVAQTSSAVVAMSASSAYSDMLSIISSWYFGCSHPDSLGVLDGVFLFTVNLEGRFGPLRVKGCFTSGFAPSTHSITSEETV